MPIRQSKLAFLICLDRSTCTPESTSRLSQWRGLVYWLAHECEQLVDLLFDVPAHGDSVEPVCWQGVDAKSAPKYIPVRQATESESPLIRAAFSMALADSSSRLVLQPVPVQVLKDFSAAIPRG